MDRESIPPEDREFLRNAVEKGLLSEEKSEEILAALLEKRATGETVGASALAVERGLMDASAARSLVEESGEAGATEGDQTGEAKTPETLEEAPAARPAEAVPGTVAEAEPAKAAPAEKDAGEGGGEGGTGGKGEAKPKVAKALPVEEEATSGKKADREARRKAAKERMAERRKSDRAGKKRRLSPFVVIVVLLVILGAGGIAAVLIFLKPGGPTIQETMQRVEDAREQKKWMEAFEAIDAFLDEEPAEADAAKARAKREALVEEVTPYLETLKDECRKELEEGDMTSVGEALSKGETFLALASRAGVEAGGLEADLKEARSRWEELQRSTEKAEQVFATGKADGEVRVPRGDYTVTRALEVREKASFVLEEGATLSFSDDKDLVVRHGASVTIEPGARLVFESNAELAVNRGATVTFQEGSKAVFGPRSGILSLGRLVVAGTEERPVTLEAADLADGFYNVLLDGEGASGSTLTYATIEGGRGREIKEAQTEEAETNGGGVAVIHGASVTLDHVTIKNCNAGGGAGVFAMKSEVKLVGCTLESNKSSYWGGGIFAYQGSTIEVQGGVFRENYAYRVGGGLEAQDGSTVALSEVTFVKNQGSQDGGACALYSGAELKAEKVRFEDNRAGTGGACSLNKSKGEFVACVFKENKAGHRAGAVEIGREAGYLFDDCAFEGNLAAQDKGGAVMVAENARAQFRKGSFASNRAPDGGAVFVRGPAAAVFDGVSFSENRTMELRGRGGALLAEPASYLEQLVEKMPDALPGVELKECTFTGNASRFAGGAISVKGMTVEITGGRFEGNSAGGGRSGGGGVLDGYGRCKVTVSGTRFSENEAKAGSGGVFFLRRGGEIRVENGRFEKNEGGQGGVAYLDQVRAVIEDSEFRENEAKEGGAIYVRVARGESLLETRRVVFHRNKASRTGGALRVSFESRLDAKVEIELRLEGGRMEDNRADTGGAFHFTMKPGPDYRFTADFRDVELASNRASAGRGGAGAVEGPVRLDGVAMKVRKNRAEKDGGGLYLDGAEATLERCVIEENEAEKGKGGGVFYKGEKPEIGEETKVQHNRPDEIASASE